MKIKNLKVNLTALTLAGTLLLTGTCLEGEVKAVDLTISKGVNVYVNDTLFVPKDAKGNEVRPFIYNGSTYLPVRAVGEAYGVKIDWDGRVIISGNANKDVVIPSANKPSVEKTNVTVSANTDVEIIANGEKFVPKDANGKVVPVILTGGTTYLPVRAISNLYGVDINWDSKTGSVYIGKHEIKEKPSIVRLERDSDGKYILPDTYEENMKLAAQGVEVVDYYTELLKPYSNKAIEIKAKYDEISMYEVRKLGDLFAPLFCGNFDEIAPTEVEVIQNIYDELTLKSGSLISIAYAERDNNLIKSKYKNINQYETDFGFYQIYHTAINAVDKYNNLSVIMKDITTIEEQQYKTRIDEAVNNLKKAINGKSYTLN